MADIAAGKTFGTTESVTAAKLNSLVDDATITNIVRADLGSNFFGITTKATEPTSLGTGEVWYDTTEDMLKVFNGVLAIGATKQIEDHLKYNDSQTHGSTVVGDVLVVDTATDNTVTTTVTDEDDTFAGIAMEAVADEALCRIALIGLVTVNFTGTGSRGDFAFCSTTSGAAKAVATYTDPAWGILTTDVAAGVATVMIGTV